jgi:uncharacterized protein YbbK (DUF523 family)
MTLEEKRQRLAEAKVVLVSACLLGEACRYDAKDQRSERVYRALEGKEVVPICPEAGAGLGIPRPPVELSGGGGAALLEANATAKVKQTGADVSEAFRFGAHLAVQAARTHQATVAILRERSPSCGANRVWIDGSLEHGQGATAAALDRAGVIVLSDEEV